MKHLITFYVIILASYTFSATQAVSNQETREKRSLALERCPENSTSEECDAYAEEKSKQIKFCHTFERGLNLIHWEGCGRVYCGENTKLIKQDLSTSYPDCCEHCEIIDENKEAYVSGTL